MTSCRGSTISQDTSLCSARFGRSTTRSGRRLKKIRAGLARIFFVLLGFTAHHHLHYKNPELPFASEALLRLFEGHVLKVSFSSSLVYVISR